MRISSIRRLLYNMIDEPGVILLYHRVTSLPIDTHLLAVAPDHFYEQIATLKKDFNLLSAEEFTHIIKNRKKFPPKSILLTFDDGYADNYLEAIPILESMGASAIFYITTSKLNTDKMLWWDELEDILISSEQPLPSTISLEVKSRQHTFPTKTPSERLETHSLVHPLIKANNLEAREQLMNRVREWAGASPKENRYHRLLTHHELVAMSKSPACVVGAHTRDHPMLSQLTAAEQLFQIKSSQDELERITGKRPIHFSYPFGTLADYDASSVKICKDLAFEIVSSNYYDQVHSWTDRFQLPRMLVRNWNREFFRTQVNRYFRW